MFPPCAFVLFQLVLFLSCLPPGVFSLLLLALEKRLYLREKDTGRGTKSPLEPSSRGLLHGLPRCIAAPSFQIPNGDRAVQGRQSQPVFLPWDPRCQANGL